MINHAELDARREQLCAERMIESAIDDLFTQINSSRLNDAQIGETIATSIMKQHRTLQQDFWRMMFKRVIPEYATNAKHDLRNEEAVQACKLVEGEMVHSGFSHI